MNRSYYIVCTTQEASLLSSSALWGVYVVSCIFVRT